MTFERERAEKFDLGRVVSRTLGTIRGNLVTYYALALVSAGLPVALMQMLQVGALGHAGATSAAAAVFSLTAVVVGLIAKAFCNSFLISGALAALEGRSQTIGAQLRAGRAVIFPVIGIEILCWIVVCATTVLLIVPGVIVACMLCVAVPAEVAERTGVFAALSRSAALTKGHRWSIFGTLALYIVTIGVIGGVISLVVGLIFFGGFGKSYLNAEGGPLAYVGILLMALLSAGYTMIGAVGLAALYAELRLVKEGPKTQSLAEVFA